ncbi:MAG: DUF2817 domain-containing protein [Bdellovibrionales bacterium]|nr:DUF2817 domain-containing protein [Bdellovibrionales bacterium]
MSVTRVSTWAHSASGNNIELFHSGGVTLMELKNPILFIGGVHGDEPEGVRLADDTLDWLKSRQQTNECPDWILIPCLNPDGYKINSRVNGHGVDLNRNFPCKTWSSDYRAERYFPGPRPSSEPETQALVELIEKLQPSIIVHCHSWEPCIVYSGNTFPNFVEDLRLASGYEAKDDIGYQTPGSLGEYGWNTHQITVICIEEKEGNPLDCVWTRFRDPIQKLFSGVYYKNNE